jgi:predicted Zn-dependent peptidase
LIYKKKGDVKIKVEAISLLPDNTKILKTVGDEDGETHTLHFYNLTEAELRALNAKDLVDNYIKKINQYKHTIYYFGPRPVADFKKSLAQFHKLPSKQLAYPAAVKFTRNETKENTVYFTDYKMVQAEVSWINKSDKNFDSTSVPTLQLFNEYFGGNMSGIVFQEIRESKALAYSTYAAFGSPQKKGDPFSMSAYVGCQADKMKESITAMQELLTALPKSEKLFSQSQASIKNSISTTRTTKTGILFSYLSAQKRGLNYDMNEKLYKSVDGFSYDSINSFFKQNIAGKPYTLTVVGGEGKLNWDELKKFGPVKKLTLKDVFGY